MATPNIVPRADSEGGIGTASKYWASAYIDLIYVGAGKVGRDADNLLDFSTDNEILFRAGGTNKLKLSSTTLFPSSSDGLSLGKSDKMFSDLFLASGAVINFDNGNFTLTHGTDALAIADGMQFRIGSGNDLRLYHQTHSYISNENGGNLEIRNLVDDADVIFSCDDGSGGSTEYFRLDGSAASGSTVYTVWPDNSRIAVGTDKDFNIKHDGSTTALENSTGNLYIQNQADDSDIIFTCDDGSGGSTAYLTIDGSATQVKFHKNARFNDSVRAEFGSSGDFVITHDGSDSKIENATGDLKIRNFSDDRDIIFENDNGAGGSTTYFYLDGSSAAHDGSATTGLFTNWPDKSNISLGTSHDLRIYHDSSSSYIQNETGNLNFMSRADDADMVFYCDNGSGGDAEYFRLDGSAKDVGFSVPVNFGTDGNGHDVILRGGTSGRFLHWDASQDSLEFTDDVIIKIGTNSDLQIEHDGSHSYIRTGSSSTGNLIFSQNSDDANIVFKSDDGSGGIATYFELDGGNVRTTFAKPGRFLDSVELQVGLSADLKIYHDGSHSYIDQVGTGDLYIRQAVDDKAIIFQCDDGSGGVETYFELQGVSGGAAPFTVFPDSSVAAFGSGHDFRIEHTGSHTVLDHTGTGNLFIKNSNDDADIIFQSDDGSGSVTPYITLDGGDVSTIINTIKVMMPNLPTSDPSNANQLWNDSGTLKISAG